MMLRYMCRRASTHMHAAHAGVRHMEEFTLRGAMRLVYAPRCLYPVRRFMLRVARYVVARPLMPLRDAVARRRTTC